MIDQTTGLNLVPHAVEATKSADHIILKSRHPLDAVVENTGVWLHKWAHEAPDRVFLAERSGDGWRELTYAQVLAAVRGIASSLAARGMGPDTPIVIMSGNSVDHALLSLGAQYAGVPTSPLAEQYSLITEAHGRLIYVLDKIKPAMAFVDDAARYATAIGLPNLDGVEIVASQTDGALRDVTAFSDLLKGDASVDVDAVHAKVTPDTLAKILFTSGSSSDPKGVLTTQKMMCVNQAQMASVLPFLKERPPVINDWLPWNHVFGGSHNVNMMLAHGGTFYIDDGKPTKKGFARTVENIMSRPGTLAFNVPVGFAMLAAEMDTNTELRKAYMSDLDMLFYAGASLPQDVWTSLERAAMQERGRLPLMISSWGMTETAPATVMLHEPIGRSGVIGVPLPGTEIKLLPDDEMRCELRVKGHNIMKSYYGDPVKTAEAFDDDGFLITGDAVKFVDVNDVDRGLVFDGRVSEDFKLLTGTWVQAGKLRLDALDVLQGLVQDVVICGHDRDQIGLLIFPRPTQVHGDNSSNGAVIDAQLHAQIDERLRALASTSSGSAKRISRAIILSEAPSLKDHEITDKGSLNVRKIITRRADLIERLYDNEDPALIRI
ncbi:feruloyl-CoA synthase [Pacificibacter marinus]|uniref:Long-chain-fatty-acid--CoA ligase n=1 Tax=Pacificibacter marinus TaxID=658057 RepID=A0A1Y5RJK2_9RHOB|nr:feruloyl-CoA synthase [Pacificibacter marinus]SEK18730.1 feruloyl-CoA synthase [Pacificibacter marinus]SLN17790.1 Long-chain-fatty-acid--CoA ligase [Pacificibacter marinus]